MGSSLLPIKRFHSLLMEGKLKDFVFHKCERIFILNNCNWPKKQERMLMRVLKYANRHCSYYRSLNINVKNIESIKKYPLLSKDTIKSNFQDFISDDINHMVYYVGHTGGSTGEPLELYSCPGIDDLFQIKLWKSNGYEDGDIILAMDGAKISDEAISENRYLYTKSKKQIPYGGFGLSSLYLTSENIGLYCQELIKLKPSFIRGYPSFIYRIASYMKDNQITIDFRMKAVELTSESSFGYQHDLIREVFGCKVIMQYGHTESCVFGYTYDETMRYRIEPLYGYVEIIKEDGKSAEIGEVGEVIVTTLHNTVMPLIRYRTGDYAEFGGYDKDGLILNRVLGRTQDYIVNADNEKVILTALIFAQHFDALGNMIRWQIEQFEAGTVIIHIIKRNSFTGKDEDEIRNLFWNLGKTKTIFNYVDTIELTGRGKSMMLVQHIKMND